MPQKPLVPDMMSSLWSVTIVASVLVLLVGLVLVAVFARYFRFWIQSITTGAGIGIFDLLGMTFRKVNPTVIVRSKIMAVQAGIGDRDGVTSKAPGGPLPGRRQRAAGDPRARSPPRRPRLIDLDFKLATAIDLAGRNVLEAVQTSVYPKVIDCPLAQLGRETLDARGQKRHPAEGQGPRHRARQPEAVDRRGHRGDDHRPRRRGHRQRDRLGRIAPRSCWRTPTAFPRPCWPGGSIRRRPSRSSRSTSPTSTWARTSAPACRPIRPRPTCASPGPTPKAAARWPWPQEQEMIAQIEESRAKVVEAEAEVPKAIAEAFRERQAGHHGLLQAAQRAGRYRHADGDRPHQRPGRDRCEEDLAAIGRFASRNLHSGNRLSNTCGPVHRRSIHWSGDVENARRVAAGRAAACAGRQSPHPGADRRVPSPREPAARAGRAASPGARYAGGGGSPRRRPGGHRRGPAGAAVP